MKKTQREDVNIEEKSKKDSRKNHVCDALRDLVSFVQFEEREKNSWRSVTFSKVAG